MSAKPTSESEKEFVIPTMYKSKIGSYLSWPVGAVELTKALLVVPQITEFQLKFRDHYPTHSKGKWPVSFPVIEARYAFHRTQFAPIAGINEGHWNFEILPVPRNMRAEIREAFQQQGFGLIAQWLVAHADFSSREGNLSLASIWNSETKELTFESRDYVLPEVSSAKHQNKK